MKNIITNFLGLINNMKDRIKSWKTTSIGVAINKFLLRIIGTRPNDR